MMRKSASFHALTVTTETFLEGNFRNLLSEGFQHDPNVDLEDAIKFKPENMIALNQAKRHELSSSLDINDPYPLELFESIEAFLDEKSLFVVSPSPTKLPFRSIFKSHSYRPRNEVRESDDGNDIKSANLANEQLQLSPMNSKAVTTLQGSTWMNLSEASLLKRRRQCELSREISKSCPDL